MSRGPFVPPRGPFGRPSGILGWIGGHVMAWSNQPMNQRAAELLEVRPDERVLEIGFGPGRLIQVLALRASAGLVAGVDPSEVMLGQAARRNREFIRQGRVELRLGTVSRLPFPDRHFTRVCALNSVQFWPSPEDDLREVSRVMEDGGLLLLGLRVNHPDRRFATIPGIAEQEVDEVEDLLRRAGFHDLRMEQWAGRHRLLHETARLILAQR
jgi:ubiquinone/menaquinone biosynthesis C-methylase UbiE